MHSDRKLLKTLLAASALLFVLAAPSSANAEPIVKNSLGEAATELHAVSGNMVLTTASGTLLCTTMNLDFTLSENTTETATGSGTGEAVGSVKKSTHSGPCETFAGLPTGFTSITLGEIHLEPGGTGLFTIEAVYDFPGSTHPCAWDGIGALTYEAGTDVLTLEVTLAHTGQPPCHKEAELRADFTVTDENGEPATIG